MENKTAVFGGGCFWCTEAIFKMVKGSNQSLPVMPGGMLSHPLIIRFAAVQPVMLK